MQIIGSIPLLLLLLAISTCFSDGDDYSNVVADAVTTTTKYDRDNSNNHNLRRELQDDPEDEYEIIYGIVGGSNAPSGRYPNFVQYSGGGCGATLIWEDIVLGAAHCGLPRNNGLIIQGNRTRRQEGDYRRDVARSRTHRKYSDRNTLDYDFLIMKLDRSVPGVIQPASPNPRSTIPAVGRNNGLTAVGYGDQCNGCQNFPTRLQEVRLTFVPHLICNSNYNGDLDRKLHLCAIGSGRDTCQGDSGGPLFDESGALVGITSFGRSCAQRGTPGVYARVSGSYNWIFAHMCCLSDNPPESCSIFQRVLCMSAVDLFVNTVEFVVPFATRFF